MDTRDWDVRPGDGVGPPRGTVLDVEKALRAAGHEVQLGEAALTLPGTGIAVTTSRAIAEFAAPVSAVVVSGS